jgi:hypothetical protein
VTASGSAVLVLTGMLLASSSATASAVTEPLETPASAGPTGAEHLASSTFGCWDPQSWVWQAPRAERVTLTARPGSADPTVCEIGTEGCARRPETTVPDLATSTWEAAALTCDLKRAHHEQRDGAEPFDAKSCLESQLTLWSGDDGPLPARPRPFERIVCAEQDPQCVPMPPLPAQPEPPLSPPPATATAPRRPPSVLSNGLRLGDAPGAARPGHRRRVDRPPNA